MNRKPEEVKWKTEEDHRQREVAYPQTKDIDRKTEETNRKAEEVNWKAEEDHRQTKEINRKTEEDHRKTEN